MAVSFPRVRPEVQASDLHLPSLQLMSGAAEQLGLAVLPKLEVVALAAGHVEGAKPAVKALVAVAPRAQARRATGDLAEMVVALVAVV